MKIDIITIFPEMFQGFLTESIIKRAIEKKKVEINIHDLRDYSTDIHKRVDDYGFGGGQGMVLMIEPIDLAINDLKQPNSKVILMSPQGKLYKQEMAYNLAKETHLIIICGHYEGFDERILNLVDMEISVGDYIVTGGEIPSMIITDSITRLLDGVINEESHLKESFHDNLLDYPVYTKPRVYKEMEVPEILISGDHSKIDKWREEQRYMKTVSNRPDLLKKE